jgi:hypothetical protein
LLQELFDRLLTPQTNGYGNIFKGKKDMAHTMTLIGHHVLKISGLKEPGNVVSFRLKMAGMKVFDWLLAT